MMDESILTRFVTPTSETPKSSGFLSRLLNRGSSSRANLPLSQSMPVCYRSADELVQTIPIAEGQSTFYQSSRPATSANLISTPSKSTELRTFPAVLTRIMTIIDKKSSGEGLKSYNDSAFKQSWMPDSSCKECYDCGSKFTTFLRRHHCRICGQIFCSRCCNQEVPGGVIGFSEGLRACTYCCGVVSSFMQMEGSDDLGTLKDNVAARLNAVTTVSSHPTTQHTHFMLDDPYEPSNAANLSSVFDMAPPTEPMEGMSTEERQALVQDSVQLKLLYYEMKDPVSGIALGTHRQRLRTFNECCYGHELVAWLMDEDKANDRSQAIAIGQAMMDAKFIYSIGGNTFRDGYSLYKFYEPVASNSDFIDDGRRLSLTQQLAEDEPNWLQELDQLAFTDDALSLDFSSTLGQSSHQNSFTFGSSERAKFFMMGADNQSNSDNASNSTLHARHGLSDRNRIRYNSNEQILNHYDDVPAGVDPLDITSTLTSTCENKANFDDTDGVMNERFEKAYSEHITELCNQLLVRYNLSQTWSDIVLKLANNISRLVRPDVKFSRDYMDIGAYVHIKKVRSGTAADSDIIYGVVCTKRIVHNKMRSTIYSPKIMLLQSSIEYQRVTNKFSSLEPQMLQEQEYLQNCVSRICKHRPDILLVENTVSRVAQELLLMGDITVVVNVKASVMQRISRMTMADIVPSIDSLLSRPQLGTCYKFSVETFRFSDGYYKTLMLFHGCPANLGCTVLLRGQSYDELSLVKPILMMIIYSCYNAKLELSYMMNQSAILPPNFCRNSKTEGNSGLLSREGSSNSEEATSSSSSLSPSVTTKSDTIDKPTKRNEKVKRSKLSSVFHHLLPETILDCSPFIQVELPYFETYKGHHSSLRKVFSEQPYWSVLMLGQSEGQVIPKHFARNEIYDHRLVEDRLNSLATQLTEPHEFAVWGVDCAADQKVFKQLATKFRASGARLKVKDTPYSFLPEEHCYTERPKNKSLKIDCFDTSHHQKICVLFSSFTLQHVSGPNACVYPWIVNMQFYGCNDMTLGTFLEHYCFRESYRCPREGCTIPVVDHIRRFVHDNGCVYLIVRKVLGPLGADNSDESIDRNIITWSWCKKCKKATAPVPLSLNSWHLSFAKFIQLRLKCQLTGSRASDECTHSLVRDYYQYYRFKDTVATFKYSGITLRDVYYPPAKLTISHSITSSDIKSRVTVVHSLGMGLYSAVMENLHFLEVLGVDSQGKKQVLDHYKEEFEREKSWFLEKIDKVHTELLEHDQTTDGVEKTTPNQTVELLYALGDELIRLKQRIAKTVQQWNIKIVKFTTRDEKQKDNEKKVQKGPSDTTGKSGSPKSGEASFQRGDFHTDAKKDEVINSSEPSFANLASTPPTQTLSELDPEGPILSTELWMETSGQSDRTDSESSARFKDDSISSQESNTPCDPMDSFSADGMYSSVTPGMTAGIRNRRATTVISTDSDGSFVMCSSTDETRPHSDLLNCSNGNIQEVSAEMEETLDIIGQDSVDILAHQDEPDLSGTLANQGEQNSSDTLANLDEPESSDVSANHGEQDSTDASVNQSEQTVLDMLANQGERDSLDTLANQGEDNNKSSDPSTLFYISVEKNGMSSDEILTHDSSQNELDSLDFGTFDFSKQESNLTANSFDSRSFAQSSQYSGNASTRSPRLKKSGSRILDSIKTAIISPSEGPPSIESPFSENQHYLLWPTVHVPVIVYDEEQSSIIAYTLGSQSYDDSLIELQKQYMLSEPVASQDLPTRLPKEAVPSRDRIEEVLKLTSVSSITAALRTTPCQSDELSTPAHNNAHDHFNDQDDVDLGKQTGKNSYKSHQHVINPHIELQFTKKSEAGEKMALFYCKVYFAVEFKKLRRLILPGGEEQFIRSLSRCYKWNAKGGKSGLGFCKTLDGRFIIKQMNKQEVQSFMEFGPSYFDYLTKSINKQGDKHVSVLAKILGVYRIGFRNFVTGSSNKQDVLVMENLFYNRKMSKVFDLKGSDRNRLAKQETTSDAVLLDENFLYYIKHNPMYMRRHTRSVFLHSLAKDTHFLSSHTVMDYSLLCGIDEESKELVVGIIDYIRTFTWDKKLETVVKSSGILGGQGKMPTIVSPEVYRTRFMEAMDRYFFEVPNRWTGLSSDDC